MAKTIERIVAIVVIAFCLFLWLEAWLQRRKKTKKTSSGGADDALLGGSGGISDWLFGTAGFWPGAPETDRPAAGPAWLSPLFPDKPFWDSVLKFGYDLGLAPLDEQNYTYEQNQNIADAVDDWKPPLPADVATGMMNVSTALTQAQQDPDSAIFGAAKGMGFF